MTNLDQTTQPQPFNQFNNSTFSTPPLLFSLKLFEYLFLTAFVGSVIISILLPNIENIKIYEISFLAIVLFFFLINQQVFGNYQRSNKRSQINRNAELYSYIFGENVIKKSYPITPARIKALEYCQELIEDYKRTRRNCQYIYYISQLSTIVLSGVTPILVLVDKLEVGVSWLKWLPVICPAIAAIVASIVTSFPFQENWIAANTVVELLEAEQEKFILGVSPLYNYDISEESQLAQNAQKAVENFIIQVNNIHLKQLTATTETKTENKSTDTENTPDSAQSKT